MSPRTARLLFLVALSVPLPPAVAETPRPDLHGDPLPPGAIARIGSFRLRSETPFTALAWSADGRLLASANQGLLQVWEAETGKELRQLTNDVAALSTLAFAPDGTLAAADSNDVIHLWDASNGKELRRLSGHRGKVVSLAFFPDGKTLASSSFDKTVCLWDVATGKTVREFAGHDDLVYAVAVAPDGQTVASADVEGKLLLWDAATGKERVRATGKGILDLAFAPDGKTLVSGDETGGVRSWDAVTGAGRRSWAGHSSAVMKVAFGRAGATILSGSVDGTLRCWDTASDKMLYQCQQGDAILALAVAPDGRTVATAGKSPTIRFWETTTGKEMTMLPPAPKAAVEQLRFASDGRTLVTAERGNVFYRWDAATGKQLARVFNLPFAENPLVALSADGEILAAWAADGYCSIVQAANGKVVRRSTFRRTAGEMIIPSSFSSLTLSADGRTLAVSGIPDTPEFMGGPALCYAGQTAADRRPALFETEAESLQLLLLSPDGKTLAGLMGDKRQTLQLWELVTGRPRLALFVDLKGDGRLVFSPDGRAVAVWGSDDRTLHLWDSPSRREMRACPAEENIISAAAFSPDNRLVAVATKAGDVILRSVATGKELRRLKGHRQPVRALTFAPDGRTLASGCEDKTALLWAVDEALAEAEPPKPLASGKLSMKELQDRWDHLTSADASAAFEALAVVAETPEQAVPWIREHLRPVAPEPGRIERLIADLDSDRFATRQKANDELERLGRLAEPALHKALDDKPGLEMRQRLERLLTNVYEKRLSGDDLRGWRTVEALERMGTSEARQLLKKLAEETPSLAEEAKASLQRLSRRPLPR